MTAPYTTAATAQSNVASGVLQSVRELSEVLNAETTALRERNFGKLDEFTRRKSQALMQILNTLDYKGTDALPGELREALTVLRLRLTGNAQELQLHVKAAKEISDTLSRLTIDAESDGTYSRFSNGQDF